MEDFIDITCVLIGKMGFSPLVLIGLLIASLSLILNLKSTNNYIQKFKNSKNLDKFINLIFYTSFVLLIMFVLSILSKYFTYEYILALICIIYILLLSFIVYSLFTIVFILKEIVRTSLKDD